MEHGDILPRPSHDDQEDPDTKHQRVESTDNDTIGMLAQAAPTAQYEEYNKTPDPPPQKPIDTSRWSGSKRLSAKLSTLSSKRSTPPVFPLKSPLASITTNTTSPTKVTCDAFPTAMPTRSPPVSPGFRPRLFGNRSSGGAYYPEDIAWANSTQFRPTTADAPKPKFEAQVEEAARATGTIVPPPSSSKQYFREARRFRESWRAGVWRRFPWKGFGALGLVFLLTIGSAIILFLAEGTSPEGWGIGGDSVQPQVYISVLEMLMDLFVFCALAEGLVITFWRRLMQGASLADVHDVHDLSFLLPAVRQTFRLQFNAVAIASIITVLSLSRGPFFQRAIVLKDAHYHTNTAFVVVGLLVSLASIIAILPLYHRYWDLGRKVSLNPLEIARAFGAPLFDGLDGNMTSSDIEIERGAVYVKYGACEQFDGEKVLRVEDTARVNVRAPWEGEILG